MTPTLVRRGAMLFALAFATPFLLSAQAATGTVSGRITDASIGRGLPDVQVLITGTRIGAVTGPNGEYTLVGVPTGSRSITTSVPSAPSRSATSRAWPPAPKVPSITV